MSLVMFRMLLGSAGLLAGTASAQANGGWGERGLTETRESLAVSEHVMCGLQ